MADGTQAQVEIKGQKQHLQHGPIDLILQAWGTPQAVAAAYDAARARFASILSELVDELAALRAPADGGHRFTGSVARRMACAVAPLAGHRFITPMAAVAGAVADEVLAVMRAHAPLTKAYVNNGGDIAVHVSHGETLNIGLVPRPDPRLASALLQGTALIEPRSGTGGIATSGRFGRSFSLGIADAVTVTAISAASADAAATLIANAVDLASDRIIRKPAATLDPDSDLGERLVTVHVPPLDGDEIERALAAGTAFAQLLFDENQINGAVLYLQDQAAQVGGAAGTLLTKPKDTE